MRFRLATTTDCAQLHRVINAAYRDKARAGWTTEAHLVRDERVAFADLQIQLSKNDAASQEPIFVAVTDNDQNQNQETENAETELVLGCIQAELSAGHPQLNLPAQSALIGLFAVDPSRQSAGIGGFLLRELEGYLKRELNIQTAVLWVIQQRLEIQRWYKRHGYAFGGETRPFVAPDKALEADLYFKVYTKEL